MTTDRNDIKGQKVLARFRKDENHQRFPKRTDPMFAPETHDKEEAHSLQAQLKVLIALTLTGAVGYLIFKQVLNMIRKKRVVSLKSLSSTFSMLKHL